MCCLKCLMNNYYYLYIHFLVDFDKLKNFILSQLLQSINKVNLYSINNVNNIVTVVEVVQLVRLRAEIFQNQENNF